MNSDLVERIKEAVGPEAFVNGEILHATMKGAEAALEYAALCYRDMDSACSHEVQNGEPGTGAIGAVLVYRDRIRALKD